MPRADKVKMQGWVASNSGRHFGWMVVSIEDALKSGEHQFRCVECDQPVRLHQDRKGKMASHPEHRKRNPQCSLSDPLP